MAPVIIGATIAAAGAAASGAIAGLAAAAITANAIIAGAISLVLGGITRALAPDPPSLDQQGSNNIKSRGLTRSVRQPITTHKIVYGEVRVSGAITFFEVTNDNQFLHMVIVIAANELEEIGEIWVNDYSITPDMIDGNGNVTEGRYADALRIKKYLGTDTQTADPDLVAETSATTDYRGRGIAYIYVRFDYDRDIYPSGVPNISAWVKGKPLYDTRDASTRYSANIPLMLYDYFTNDRYGFGADTNQIDTTILNASANNADEIVDTAVVSTGALSVDNVTNEIELNSDLLRFQTGDRIITSGTPPAPLMNSTNYYVIPVQRKKTDYSNPRIKLATSLANAYAGVSIDITGTSSSITINKNGEPRYAGGGVLDTAANPQVNVEDMLSGMAGRAPFSGGKWYIESGKYKSPTVTLSEAHIVSPISVQTKVSRESRFNTVKGTYISQINNGQPSDYPSVTNSTYVTQDNGETIIKEYDLPFTQRPHTAQRISKIELEKARQEIAFEAEYSLHAMQVRAGDNVLINNDRFGWNSKPFEVVDWQLISKEGRISVKMVLRETATTVYDWNSGEETAVDPAPNTNLTDPFTVPVVGGFSLDSILVDTQASDKTFKVLASWDLSDDRTVRSGGVYEIEYKRSSESIYKSAAKVDGLVQEQEVAQLEPDVLYDIRIFAYNGVGVRSSPTAINGFKVGDTATTNTEDWENETILLRDGADWESDSESAEDWEN